MISSGTSTDCSSSAILVDVLKVPEPLTWQKPFLPEELNEFFEPILSASEDRDVSTCRADHLAAGNCPVCFHEMTTIDKPTIECDDCHVKVHQRCFNVWAMHKEGYGSLECISCRIKWTQAGKWGTCTSLLASLDFSIVIKVLIIRSWAQGRG